MKIKNKKLLEYLLRPDWHANRTSDLVPLKFIDDLDDMKEASFRIISEIYSRENLDDENITREIICIGITKFLRSSLKELRNK